MSERKNGATGNGHQGTVSRLASQAIRALSPQFLALIILNMIFFGVFFWFADARATHTMAVINQLLQSCLQEVSHAK